MANKFKVGDKVRFVGCESSSNGKRGCYGKIGVIATVDTRVDYPYTIEPDNGWRWKDAELEAVEMPKIVITTDGKTTTAKLYEDGKVIKTAEAICSPEDEFNFMIGARLASDRLRVKYKKGDKVKVVKNTCWHTSAIGEIVTLTKVYEITPKEVRWEYEDHCGYITEDDVEPYVEPEVKPTDNWRVVNRPAKKGDYIRLVNGYFSFDKIGDILKVHSVDCCVQVADRDCPHRTGEYDPDYLWNYSEYTYEVVERIYKPGDKVKITGNSCNHFMKVGDVITLRDNDVKWTKNAWHYKENCGYIVEKDFEPYTESTESTEPPKPKYYNGKVVCIESNDSWFTVGKIYEFIDGVVKDNDGDERPTKLTRAAGKYTPIEDFTNTWCTERNLKFIPLVES